MKGVVGRIGRGSFPASGVAVRLAAVLARARQAEPLEFDQILTRFVIYIIISVYLAWSYLHEGLEGNSALVIAVMVVCAWTLGIGFLVHLTLWPERRIERRATSIIADAAALSLLIGFGERSAAIFFPVFLWVTLGNGFRYGVNYLYAAIAANLTGFAIMAYLTPYWSESWQFSAGLALAILLIPLYVAKLIRKLHKAMNEAEAASLAKTEFLSMISHELRTPLTAILGLAYVSKVTASSAKERFSAISTELAAGRLLRMVDTILKFQRIESGAIERNDESFDPLDMLQDVRAIIEPLARQKGLGFHIRFTTGLPPALLTDPDHVQTIILNLMTNAVKYTRRGDVSLEIGMAGTGSARSMRIGVRDTGIGIQPEAQSRIFDRFVRAQDHNVAAEAGVGLGLATCKSLTELLGGRLGFDSVYGSGSLFWAEIPVTVVEADLSSRPGAGSGAAMENVQAAPVYIVHNGDLAIVARKTGAKSVTPAEAMRMVGEGPRAVAAVFVATPEALGRELCAALADGLNRDEPSFALVLAGALPMETGLSELAAAAFVDVSVSESTAADIISTVARWHWRASHRFGKQAANVTSLTRSLTVLVADDNELNCQVVRRMLELSGHRVILARTGDDALALLLDGGVEVALLDVNMPGMSGIDVCRAYRAGLGSGAVIPVLALTADISDGTRKECLKAGMMEVIGKPVSLEQLSEAFNTYVLRVAPKRAGETAAQNAVPAHDAPVDERRAVFLRDLFGDRGVDEQFLPSFERDLRASLARLRRAVGGGSPSLVSDALHAIKSSASTAGALRILGEVAAFRQDATPTEFEAFQARVLSAFAHYQENLRQRFSQAADETSAQLSASSV